jgi:hypothetical protein
MSGLPEGEWVVITVRGHLSEDWAEWFEGLTIENTANGESILSGIVADQAELHGVLERIRDMNLALVFVQSRSLRG